jgi:uncharacterized protein YggE
MRFKWLTVLMFATSLASFSQAVQVQAQPNNTIAVSAEGKFETNPDTCLFQFAINVQEKNSADAYAHASKDVEAVRQALKNAGLDVKQAEISQYSVQPIYDYKNSGKRKVTAYKVSTSVSIKLKDFAKVGPLTESLSTIDDAENLNVSYSLENIEQAKLKAVEDGTRKALQMAEMTAKTGHRDTVELSTAAVDTTVSVWPRYTTVQAEASTVEVNDGRARAYVAAPPPPPQDFSPRPITITARVNAIFAIK